MPYTVKLSWQKAIAESFIDNRYNRTHTWSFDGGIDIVASSSPHVVPLPMSNEHAVDPEEALVAAVSSCHLLWFLSIAAQRNWVVSSYTDSAIGEMGINEAGKMAMLKILLKPLIVFENNTPTLEQLNDLHHQAHEKCYIANSLKTIIEIEVQ